jgi:hypothetical protein
MTIVIIAFNIILVLLGAIVAYLTRNVDSAFNESTWIGATMYCYIFLSVIFLALYYTNGDGQGSAGARYAERSAAILLAMALTLAFLFGPKFLTIAKLYFSTSATGSGGSQPSPIDTSRITDVSSLSLNTDTEVYVGGAGASARVAKASDPPPRFLTSAIWAQRKVRRDLSGTLQRPAGSPATDTFSSSLVGSDTVRRRRKQLAAEYGILGLLYDDDTEEEVEEEEGEADGDITIKADRKSKKTESFVELSYSSSSDTLTTASQSYTTDTAYTTSTISTSAVEEDNKPDHSPTEKED